jgi:hypothetical protein
LGEEAILLGTVPEHASFHVVWESQKEDNKIFICCNLFMQSSVLRLAAILYIYSYLWMFKEVFLKYMCGLFSTSFFSFSPFPAMVPSSPSKHSQRYNTGH